MADRCDAVVVGGGIMGASAALHLLQAGVKNVRLLERDGLFEATTGAGGGFLGPWTAITPSHGPASKAIPIESYGMEFYSGLNDEGYDVDFRKNGILWIAGSEDAAAMVASMAWTQADPTSRRIPAEDLAEFSHGALNGEGVHYAQYVPEGAQVTTSKVGVALADKITKLGGTIDTRRPVTALRTTGGRISGVDTHTGPIDCDTVVMAAGAWTNQLLSTIGAFIPSLPQITSRIITDDLGLPDTLPVMMLQSLAPEEHGGGTVLWVRWHNGGLLWGGMYLGHPRHVLVDAPVPDRLDELPTDGVLENQRMARNAKFFPALSAPTSIRVRHGAPCYTPDNLPLVGPVPGVEGLFALAGDNELGVTQGPGFGRVLADHIAHGSSDLTDLETWRIDRFGDRFPDQASAFEAVAYGHPHPASWDESDPDFGRTEKALA